VRVKGYGILIVDGDVTVTDGLCRSELSGDHNDMKYRPCSVAQAWRRLMIMEPRDGLWREISGN